MASVTLDDVTKRYGEVVAVDHMSLAVEDGELMVLLGPSGCGKTTALRMIAGLEDATEGTIRIGDRVVNDVEPRHRDVSMVFQNYALYPHLTVEKNIASPLLAREMHVDGEDGAVRKLSRTERKERVNDVARLLGLESLLARKPSALSGGQRQRVALARAIVARPKVFLMDEPLSNLDAKLRVQTRGEIVDLHQRLGTTIIYVTHDQVEALTMANRIALIEAGRLQQVGDPQSVYDRPANLFVARFLGTPPMNTVEGTITTTGGLGVRIGGVTVSLPPTPGDSRTNDGKTEARASASVGRIEQGRPVVLGIRSEHLQMLGGAMQEGGSSEAAQVASGFEPLLTGTVAHVEWLGHESLVTVAIGSGPPGARDGGTGSGAGSSVAITSSMPTDAVIGTGDSEGGDVPGSRTTIEVRLGADEQSPRAGATVTLFADPRHLHLFDLASGQRLAWDTHLQAAASR